MDNGRIIEFLEANACKNKEEIIKKITKKFKLDIRLAEIFYKEWKKEYMKFKGIH